MKRILTLSLLLLSTLILSGQGLDKLRYRDFVPVKNADSLEETVVLQKNNPPKYLIGLITLENSRGWPLSEGFGKYLPLIDSLSRKLNAPSVQAFYLILWGRYINRTGHERVKMFQYLTKALDIFIHQADTSGMIRCYYGLSFLNVSGLARVPGSPEMAKMYSQKLLPLAEKSNWPGDKLLARQNILELYTPFFQQHPDSLINLIQQSLQLIKANPQFDYFESDQLNGLALAYGLKGDYRHQLQIQLECLRITPEKWLTYRRTYNYNLGNSYYNLKKFDSAEMYYKESVRIGLLCKAPARLQVESVFTLAESQHEQGKFEAACKNFLIADSLKNVMQADFRTSEFLELQTKYETEKKDQANNVLQKEKRTYEIASIIAILLLGMISVLLFYLLRKNKQLDEYALFRDQIFSIISHDLRSPVMALEGLSKQAIFLIEKNETQKLELLGQKLDASILRLNGLLNNLLAWAISKNKKINSKMETLLLLPLVNEIVLLYTEIANAKNIHITVTIPDNLAVRANRNGLNVIVRNLIDNAVKNSTSGIVKVDALTQKKNCIIKVCNNDVIQSPELLLKMQNQLKGSKSDYLKTASGLGLQLIAHFTKMHNGSITMESDHKKGTVFTLVLPV